MLVIHQSAITLIPLTCDVINTHQSITVAPDNTRQQVNSQRLKLELTVESRKNEHKVYLCAWGTRRQSTWSNPTQQLLWHELKKMLRLQVSEHTVHGSLLQIALCSHRVPKLTNKCPQWVFEHQNQTMEQWKKRPGLMNHVFFLAAVTRRP